MTSRAPSRSNRLSRRDSPLKTRARHLAKPPSSAKSSWKSWKGGQWNGGLGYLTSALSVTKLPRPEAWVREKTGFRAETTQLLGEMKFWTSQRVCQARAFIKVKWSVENRDSLLILCTLVLFLRDFKSCREYFSLAPPTMYSLISNKTQ